MDSGPHEGLVVSGHGHGQEAHGYCAGFGCCGGVLAMAVIEPGAAAERQRGGNRLRGTGNTFLCHDGLDSSTCNNDHGVKDLFGDG